MNNLDKAMEDLKKHSPELYAKQVEEFEKHILKHFLMNEREDENE